ncbi:hypothetical protein [Paraburkholderia fungorum]|uniref:hypothetical protein n=1 Tax=Paraburkholderia fungorum TaxID=134537 RepID=UPI0018367C57|nr:hypothetical protein [Paraburkholderia fungorum]MBB5547511.1 hypothetical protein [Paraburkholderia fungorum]
MSFTRKTPLRRTGFKKPEPSSAFKTSFATKTVLRAKALKTKKKYITVAEGAKYLAACRGEPCYLNVKCAHSDWADPTVVPCHDNRSSAGKGMGLKASHERTLPGCMLCHQWLDQGSAPREEKFERFDAGFERWVTRRARKMGIQLNQPE